MIGQVDYIVSFFLQHFNKNRSDSARLKLTSVSVVMI